MSFPIPDNEQERLKALESYDILDSMPEQEYDDIAQLAAHICDTPISTVALLDKNRKWHKAKYGIDKESVPREISICSHTIMGDQPLIVRDTHKHEAFRKIGMVTNPPYVRFYAGVPLINEDGYALGSLCVVDTQPKELSDFQVQTLLAHGRNLIILMELRRCILKLEKQQIELGAHQAKIEALNHQLTELSLTDDLTGLWNRRALHNELKKELSRSHRYKQPLALMMLDIDKFKKINDNHGHAYGDKAIKALSELLANETRATDCCVRYGGDEFIVLMPHTNKQQAELVANRILNKIVNLPNMAEPFSTSIGVTLVDGSDISDEIALKSADSCLYKAKKQGGNSVVFETL